MSSALQVVVPQHVVAPQPAGIPGDDDWAHQRLRSLASESGGGRERRERILAALSDDDSALPREDLQLLPAAWCRSAAGLVTHLVAHPRGGERYYCVLSDRASRAKHRTPNSKLLPCAEPPGLRAAFSSLFKQIRPTNPRGLILLLQMILYEPKKHGNSGQTLSIAQDSLYGGSPNYTFDKWRMGVDSFKVRQ